MNYRFLKSTDQSDIYRTLLTAFADYPVRSQPTDRQLHELMVRRGVSYAHSVGVFEDDRMVAVQATGLGPWRGEMTAYDVFTGVIPEFRGRRLAGGMLEFARPALRQVGCRNMFLEVHEKNEPAIKVYERVGFVRERVLACFEVMKSQFGGAPPTGPADVVTMEKPDWARFESFSTTEPSWQNSRQAIERSIDPVICLGAFLDGRYVGYAVCAPDSRDVFQIAVDPRVRRKGIGLQLFSATAGTMRTEEIRMLNIDASAKADVAFYAACGAKETIRQFEMRLAL